MNEATISVGVAIMVVGIVLTAGSFYIKVEMKKSIDSYESPVGILGRIFSPEKQDDYENLKGWYHFFQASQILFTCMAFVGLIIFFVGLIIPKDKKQVERIPNSRVPENRYCTYCREVIRYVPERDNWFCDNCRRYQ